MLNNSIGFPAEDDGFVDALRDWDERARPDNILFQTSFTMTASHLRNKVREGGISRAKVYMRMKIALFDGLFGIQDDKDIKKSVPFSSRSSGIFGRTRAAVISTE